MRTAPTQMMMGWIKRSSQDLGQRRQALEQS